MNNVSIVDLFSGVGGLTNGIQRSGLTVKAGFDIDASCKFAYEVQNRRKTSNHTTWTI